MSLFFKTNNIGNTSPAGGGSIADFFDFEFADMAARDAEFTTQDNRDKLESGQTFILIEDNGSGEADVELWVGDTAPTSYDNTNWNSITAQIPSASVIKTLYESNANTNALVDAKLEVLSHFVFNTGLNRLISDVAIQVPEGTIYIGSQTGVSGAIRALNVRSDVTSNTGLIMAQLYDDNGFTPAFMYKNANTPAIDTVAINNPVGSDTSNTSVFSFTTTEDELFTKFRIPTNQNNASVDFDVTIRLTSHVGPVAVHFDGTLTTGATGVAEIDLRNDFNPILVDSGTELFVTANCNGMVGVDDNGKFTPNGEIDRIVIERDPLISSKSITDGTHQGIDITYQSADNTFDFMVTGDSYAEPAISSLTITGESTLVDAPFTISGTKTFTYNVVNPENVQGNLTLKQDDVELKNDINPNNNSVDITVTSEDLNAGETVVFQLSGVNTQSGTFSRSYTIRARQPHELVYINHQSSSSANAFSTVDANSYDFSSTQTVVVPTFTGQEYVAIAQPATEPDFTQLIIGGLDQLGTFTKTDNAVQIGGVNYDVYLSNSTLLGNIVSGNNIEIRR